MKKLFFLLVLVCFLQVVRAQADPVLVVVNGKNYHQSDYESYCQGTPSFSQKNRRSDECLQAFIDSKLKLDAARSLQLDTTKEFLHELALCRHRYSREYLLSNYADLPEMNKESKVQEFFLIETIYRSLPQQTNAPQQKQAKLLFDSLYSALNTFSADFSECVRTFSDKTGREWVRNTQMTEEFETAVRSLKDGEISRPFSTSEGICMVRVLERVSGTLKEVPASRRQAMYKKGLMAGPSLDALKVACNYVPNEAGIRSLLNSENNGQRLFSLNGRPYSATDFLRFSQGKTGKTSKQFEEFLLKSLLDAEYDSLAESHLMIGNQIQQDQDSILLHVIYDKEVAGKAQDRVGQEAYFTTHQKKYSWSEAKYRGTLFYCADQKIARQVKKAAKRVPDEALAQLLDKQFNEGEGKPVVIIEQGLFAKGENPFVDKLIFKKGNPAFREGYPVVFARGRKTKKPDRSAEVSEWLIADYELFLETLWLNRLRKESRVEISEEVLKTVNKD